MTHKKRKLIVEDIRNRGYEKDHFKVVQAVNVIDYQIGTCLETITVEDLIVHSDIDITIKPQT